MSIWNWVTNDPFALDGKCVECVRWQLGRNIFIKKARLDRLDKDGERGVVDVDFEIFPDLPLNEGQFTFGGTDVCLKHIPVMATMVNNGKYSGMRLAVPGDMPFPDLPAGFKKRS